MSHAHSPQAHAVQGTLRALVIALFVVTFLAQPDRIPSGSMQPTLRIGDFVMVNKLAFVHGLRLLPRRGVERGDIIVFRMPIDPARLLVKRVVAVPGDRVQMREGRVILNGVHATEPYTQFTAATSDVYRDDFPALHSEDPDVDPAWWRTLHRTARDGEIEIPPRSYFVLGDDRDNSDDSRYWGFVPADAIEGAPAAVYYSMAAPPDTDARNPLSRLTAGFRAARVLR